MARNFQIVLASRCGSLISQGTVPLGGDRPISAESAHTTLTAGETAVAPALGAELVKGSSPRAVLCCFGPWVSDLKKHMLGKAQGNSQQALGAAQGWLGGHRDTSRGELSPCQLHSYLPWAGRVRQNTWGSCCPHTAPPSPVSGRPEELAGQAGPMNSWHTAVQPLALSAHQVQRNISRPGHCHPDSLTGVTS